MRWKSGVQRRKERYERLQQWHPWFAWRPIRLKGAKRDSIDVPDHRVWLEWIERRTQFTGDNWTWNKLAVPVERYIIPKLARLFYEYR